ncbi:hypothetical protein BDZ94DRAFT_595496 [Collybia nuda]|uniref:Oxidase ustYa n=1 Tax=Collybia nuda TaxID=64659 RepID=A0A9P5Y9M9_9AGAR|nr:hypothetical protein BDZ94DRAFT_595496 [Collybia nuda]
MSGNKHGKISRSCPNFEKVARRQILEVEASTTNEIAAEMRTAYFPEFFTLKTSTILLLSVLTTVNIFRTLQQWNAFKAYNARENNLYSYVGSDHPSELPILNNPAAMIFNDTDRYDLYNTSEWNTLIPQGHGWVHLGPQRRPFSVTMYHQFHCLLSIRRAILSVKKDPSSQAPAAKSSHTNHCFSYLRQGLLCKSDLTLEPTHTVRLPDGNLGRASFGNGVLHRCHDWVQIRDYVEQNYLDTLMG